MGRIINKRSVVDQDSLFSSVDKEFVEIDNKAELTLLEAVCQIVDVVRDSNYDPSIYETAARPIAYIQGLLGLTAKQTVVYAIVMDMYYDSSISNRDIARCLSISALKSMTFCEDLEELCKRRILIENTELRMPMKTYKVTGEAIDSLQQNCAVEAIETKVKDSDDWFRSLDKYVVARLNDNMSYENLCLSVESLVNQNKDIPMIKKYLTKERLLKTEEKMLFWWICNMVVTDGFETIIPENFRKLYSDLSVYRVQRKSLSSGSNGLLKYGLLRRAESSECNVKDCYELTPWVVNVMLEELELSLDCSSSKDMIDYTSITPKQLYYNDKEQVAVEQLTSLLQPARFTEVCEELQRQGFRKGFACLFHGAPGTGKTETALQVARATGRSIMQVDISAIKSKWVGESEKNIKDIFSKYRRLVKESDIAPILLFNEADAIIGKRLENISRAVDKMENSLQNIILEELEKLEGILIATTNLTSNLDSAFERRFLYKIEFQKPTLKVKSLIWQSMISGLAADDATRLASKYDFSGGQIENVARKSVVSKILSGKNISLDTLVSHCDTELINNTALRRVGF